MLSAMPNTGLTSWLAPAAGASFHYRLALLLLLCSLQLSPASHAQDQTNSTDAPPEPTSESSASSALSSPEPEPTLSKREREQELLAKAMGDEAHWLETREGKVLALFRPTEAKNTKGALLLLHAAEDPQSWPPELETLRLRLPRYGWETLALSLPQAEQPAIPKRSAASSASSEVQTSTLEEQSSESSAEASSSPANSASSAGNSTLTETDSGSSSSATPSVSREELIKAYLLAALTFLNEQGQYNLVVLVDNSSLYWTMQLLSPQIKTNNRDPKTVDGPLQALAVINLQPQEPLTRQELEASFNQAQLPVLDLFFAPDSLDQQAQRELHEAAAMRNKLSDYQQLLIEPLPRAQVRDESNFLFQRIRGFMQRKAAGTEIPTPKQGPTKP